MSFQPVPSHLPPDGAHFVRFYEQEEFLLDEVVEFIDGALRAGGVGLLIATQAHLQSIHRRLNGFGFAAGDRTWYSGRLIALDAQQTLSEFMVEGWPDRGRFERAVGSVVADAVRGGLPVHAFGEMVALLCQDGLFDAAVELEGLWNELAARFRFHLFCAYPSRLFASGDHVLAFQRVCSAHSHVCPSERLASTKNPADLQLLLASWEQKAAALEAEVERRKQAEATLRRREIELADFVENAAEGLHRVGGDGTILWANRAELEMLGYGYDDYVGRHIAEFHVDAPVIDSILATLTCGGTLRDQPARLRCRDGSIKHVLINSNGCFEDGKLLYTRCFTRDATDRVARQRAEEQLREALLSAPIAAALLVGPDHTFRFANQRYCQMAGCSDLEGRAFREVRPAWHPEQLVQELDRVFHTGAAYQAHEVRLERTVGHAREERFVQFSLEPLRGMDGAVEGVIVVVADLTEQIRNRQKIEQSLFQREQLLSQLQEAHRAKDEFLAMLGHELRNPLSPIVTALELMQMRGDTGTSREQSVIRRQLDHLVRLVDDLLDISNVTRGKIELKKGWVTLSEVVAKAVEMASPLLEQRGHRLETHVASDVIVHVDPVRMAQVLANLLINAARYTERGGEIRLTARRPAHREVEISVKDNGIGIPASLLPKVFEMFVRGEGGGGAHGGLGIGLALVRSFVRLHGGTVDARSEGAGRGSEFLVRIPVASEGTAARDSARHEPATTGETSTPASRLRVLLVDDNVDAADTLAQLLTAAGHDVTVLNDPAATLRRAATLDVDLAILDIGMPGMDGYQLAAMLRKEPRLLGCRFVALTGYGQNSDKARSETAGFSTHFVKPVHPARLLRYASELARTKGGDVRILGSDKERDDPPARAESESTCSNRIVN
jgi:PAS domain S-box-containing protein